VRGILVAAAFGLAITLARHAARDPCLPGLGVGPADPRGWPAHAPGEDGHAHDGGIVILAGMLGGYVGRASRARRGDGDRARGAARDGRLGALGFVDDYIKVRRRRSLGLSKSAKILGQAVVAVLFTFVAVRSGDVSTELSFFRETGLDLGVFFVVWVFVILASSSNAVNLTDGLDGLASGSSIFVFSAYVFIAFWQFRHTCAFGPPEACYR